MKFLPIVADEILSQNILTIWQLIKHSLLVVT